MTGRMGTLRLRVLAHNMSQEVLNHERMKHQLLVEIIVKLAHVGTVVLAMVDSQ
ncbi:hypothetical protein Pyn_12765 [Prunus yedoensis var. nudiflora]|uniref:Uncharacterized protein n=1 Tax=Prunus yedoensis var. nudiflora TaxID=2094558 RepID=A0A314XSS0_PRUYE|nr:hypothetical protein Pyn_12765 [Prunus yedoensis var. nudiflora]